MVSNRADKYTVFFKIHQGGVEQVASLRTSQVGEGDAGACRFVAFIRTSRENGPRMVLGSSHVELQWSFLRSNFGLILS